MTPTLEQMIVDLEAKDWYTSDLYYITDGRYYLELYNAVLDNEFSTISPTFKGCYEEVYRRLISPDGD